MPSSKASTSRPASILKTDSQECVSPSSYLGMNTESPRATPKTVSISNQPEMISPLMLGKEKNVDDLNLETGRTARMPQVRGPGARRLSGRLPTGSSPSLSALASAFGQHFSNLDDNNEGPSYDSHDNQDRDGNYDSLLSQVTGWLEAEKTKRAGRKDQAKSKQNIGQGLQDLTNDADAPSNKRRGSDASDGPDLDGLESILKSLALGRPISRKSSTLSLRRKMSLKKWQRKQSGVSSDTDHVENEFHVPSSDAVLDNSQTMAYTGGASSESEDNDGDELTRVNSRRDYDAWAKFKFEIVRLVHTLRLKGWRKVPLDMSGSIYVQRLSGALTNAVYVVSPPDDLPPPKDQKEGSEPTPRKPVPKLLLRIYGPQVEHLIDREAELAILQRLARKRIGPRMLGTFANGRFEEFFHAQTLTPEDLRNPDTSRQIAKRMRELHEGIDLLDQERDDGAFVWRNWDKWVARVEQVVSWLDAQVEAMPAGSKPTGDEAWKRRGHICGVPWKTFRDVVDKYRKWLYDQYGGTKHVREQLVFAHNDTQYGNILRRIPTGESPLLLPANTHKQLIVIDFEYSSANLPGQEFANHFTEWCYNYHDARKPYACNTANYPTPEEQERFIRAYVRHRPQYNVSTPKLGPQDGTETPNRPRPTTNISDFMLDARNPQGMSTAQQTTDDEAREKETEDAEVKRILHETRLWRLANTAQWVAWGIVQAKVPGMPDFSAASDPKNNGDVETPMQEDLGERADVYKELAGDQKAEEAVCKTEEQEEEFDYLGYAQHRAMFFWGDAVQFGLIDEKDLPEEVMEKIKTVTY